jgi:hypothetical protein
VRLGEATQNSKRLSILSVTKYKACANDNGLPEFAVVPLMADYFLNGIEHHSKK